MKILAIESSCDETAVAIVEDGVNILSSVVLSQIDTHKIYGGVVPEIASRLHCESIVQITKQALDEASLSLANIDAIAVTYAPGLIGALLVGINYAKGLSLATSKPLIPVHHIRAHIAANYIIHKDLKPPFMAMVASGGHSHIIEVLDYTKFKVIGKTRDDAVGEAYDKIARVIGFPYPGGKYVDENANLGNPENYSLPRPKVDGSPYDFSFSGLKTAVLNIINNSKQKDLEINKPDLCASFQLAVCDIISERLIKSTIEKGYKTLVLAGGVAANSGIRKRLEQDCNANEINLVLPPLNLCGDNAAMIGCQAYFEYLQGNISDLSLNGVANLSVEEERF